MNKKIISILIICTLSLAILGVFSFATVKAQTSEATVLSYSSYIVGSSNTIASSPGDFVVVGEVENSGSSNLQFVYVAAAIYDSNGTLLASNENTAYGSDLAPGQKAPFYIDFTYANSASGDLSWIPNVANITVVAATTQDTTNSQYSGLTTKSLTHALDSNGLYTVTGTLANTGSQTSGPAWVVATFYNSSGSVIGVNFSNVLSQSLTSGASVAFTITPSDNNIAISSQITSFALLAQSSALQTTTSTPTPTTQPTYTAAPTSNPTSAQPTASPAANSASSTLEILVVALLVVVVIVIVVISMTYRHQRRRKAASAETSPAQTFPPSPPTSPETPPPTSP